MKVFSKMRIRFQHSVVFLLVSLGLAVLCANVQAGEIDKWGDKEGNVNYSQDPQNSSAQALNIKLPKSAAAEAGSNQEESTTATDPQTGDGEKAGEEQATKEDAAKKQEEAQMKNCQIAMKRLATITKGGRLYEVDEKGERVNWDDNTRNAKMAEAQKDVDQWCGQE